MAFSIDLEQDNSSHNNKNDMQDYLSSQDEVINKTSWRPIKGSAQGFKSHTMVKVDDNRILLKASLQSVLFNMMFIVFGLLVMFVSLFGRLLGMSGSGNPLYGVAIGLLFAGIGVFLYFKSSPNIYLDRKIKALWKGKENPTDGYTSLREIHAVQLLQKRVQGSRDKEMFLNSYYSYEVNLILKDGKRVSVLDHGVKKVIDKQADAIAELFGIPLWDGRRNFETKNIFSSWANKAQRVISLMKTIFGVIIVIVAMIFLYNMNESIKKEENMLTSLTPKEASLLAEKSTQELLQGTKDGNISLSYINTLAKHGAYLDGKDTLGRTPLFYSVKQKSFDLAKFFICKGADVNTKDNEGTKLLDLLDPVTDKFFYYNILDAKLTQEVQSRGKRVISIDRKFDRTGKMTYQKVNER